jgi:hypothetical protein
VVKPLGLTQGVPLILYGLGYLWAGGMDGVAVKCIDINQNADSEGSSLGIYRR